MERKSCQEEGSGLLTSREKQLQVERGVNQVTRMRESPALY